MRKNEVQYSENDERKKKAIIILLIAAAFLLTLGTVIAYFSDMFSTNGNITTGTLEISGTHTFYLNGTETALASINNIAPGDTIVVKGTITNLGTESAWIRERVALNSLEPELLEYVKIYENEYTQSQLLAGTGLSAPISFDEDGYAVGNSRVINAAGETTGTPSDNTDYTYIGTDTYQFSLTIYFMHIAPNSTRNLNFGFEVATQALQFRNNNDALPSDTAWQTVG